LKRSPSRALGLPINKAKVIEGALGITKRVPVEVKESLELRNKKRINIFPSKFFPEKSRYKNQWVHTNIPQTNRTTSTQPNIQKRLHT